MRNLFRYTEQEFAASEDSTGIVKVLELLMMSVVISPFRLVNELSTKFLFLGRSLQLNICVVATLVSFIFTLVNVLSYALFDKTNPYISHYSTIIATLVLAILTYFVQTNSLFYTELAVENDVGFERFQKKDDDLLNLDSDELELTLGFEKDLELDLSDTELGVSEELDTKVFDNVIPSDVLFDDPLDLFIDDPNELLGIGVNPIEYLAAEPARHLNTLMNNPTKFPQSNVDVSDSVKFVKETRAARNQHRSRRFK